MVIFLFVHKFKRCSLLTPDVNFSHRRIKSAAASESKRRLSPLSNSGSITVTFWINSISTLYSSSDDLLVKSGDPRSLRSAGSFKFCGQRRWDKYTAGEAGRSRHPANGCIISGAGDLPVGAQIKVIHAQVLHGSTACHRRAAHLYCCI